MDGSNDHDLPAAEVTEVQTIAALLGGASVLQRRLDDRLAVHELLVHGLPGSALRHLIDRLTVIHKTTSLERAVGMSLRTFQRSKDAPARLLNQEQTSRTWKFAEILARATAVLGSQEEAERWLERPATGLNQRCPLDLLATPAGVRLVEDFLDRLEYGVYT